MAPTGEAPSCVFPEPLSFPLTQVRALGSFLLSHVRVLVSPPQGHRKGAKSL